ncbi:hypothetical protein BCR34DRAFT_598865 [Clohesyomyces aquaticus]|uniref:Uncharacterized protein n=1 Tax=Clohesyomyces aquaticus TaxID=1231657 RepID=A0A1Y1ZYX2_9PLEO|nr:hypothetical protein BCR34DRAFT_598865 [Clohesyomyces aquaticus]
MHFLPFVGLLGALTLFKNLGESTAKPIKPVVIELRIAKNMGANISTATDFPLLIVRDVVLSDRDVPSFTEYRPNSTTVTILEHFIAMHRQKRKASIFKKRQDLEKRKNKECKKKKKKNYKLCEGVYKMFWNAATRQCEFCDKGKVPNPKGEKCIDPETPEHEKERGRCPEGKILDPSVSGQDHTTLYPKCIDKDQQNRCPEGQSESTPTKSQTSKCAPDDDPNKKCEDDGTYVHKSIGLDGKLKKSCRLTREKEQEKAKKTDDKTGKTGNKGRQDEARKKRQGE